MKMFFDFWFTILIRAQFAFPKFNLFMNVSVVIFYNPRFLVHFSTTRVAARPIPTTVPIIDMLLEIQIIESLHSTVAFMWS